MFMKTKKVFALMLALVMVICLSACGGSDSSADVGETEDPYANFPERSITIIVPYGAGGESDMCARPIAQAMQEAGYTVTVQNIEGAGGNIGTMECYNATPDGYTMLLHMPETMEAYYLGGDMPDHPQNMFKILCSVVTDGGMINVAPDSPFQTLEDLVAYAKEHPGEVSAACTGSMGYNRVALQMLYDTLGVDIEYIPYENSAKSKAAALGGHADIFHCQLASGVSAVKNGEIRCLAVGTAERSDKLPDVPSCTELGYDITWGMYRAIMVPKDTPDEVCQKLTEIIKTAFDSATVQEAYTSLGMNTEWLDGAAVNEYCETELPALAEAYAKLVEASQN